MEDLFEYDLSIRQYTVLKESLAKIPQSLRQTFIEMVSNRLGSNENITECLKRYFRELDSQGSGSA